MENAKAVAWFIDMDRLRGSILRRFPRCIRPTILEFRCCLVSGFRFCRVRTRIGTRGRFRLRSKGLWRDLVRDLAGTLGLLVRRSLAIRQRSYQKAGRSRFPNKTQR